MPTTTSSAEQLLARFRRAAEQAAEEQRAIQTKIDRKDEQAAKKKKKEDGKRGVQAGTRTQPDTPLPKQHLRKPGRESDLEPRPRYTAPDYKGSEKLKDMVALITGGDSGIGRAVAVLFAREGADVAIVYLDEHGDAEETRQAVEAEGRKCITISGDVRDPEFCTFSVEHTINELGHLEVLVNNAAFQEHVPSLEDLTDEHLDMTMRTNVYGYVHMARAALPYLPPGGSIINTGSETGFFGAPSLLDYSATKGAIHAFTMALAGSVKDRDIRVNAIAPGPVWTPLNPADKPADKVAEFGAESEMQRPAQPEELAPAYVFLASPVCSSYITGILLPVMGGPTG
jgi:NAD(P)-dependent dehydrogenase (short-subunit alcohol dehydrogenase family)